MKCFHATLLELSFWLPGVKSNSGIHPSPANVLSAPASVFAYRYLSPGLRYLIHTCCLWFHVVISLASTCAAALACVLLV